MPLEGLQLGHYRLLRLIGSGGMGEVYLAEDTRINRQLAVKVVRTEATPYPDANATREVARLFQREMRAITMLDHPHILPLIDFGEESVNKIILTYMVMPFRQEGSLADWLQQRGSAELLSPQVVAHFIYQAADALQHAHDSQLIHQDVKPSNFLIRSRTGNPGRPDLLLADFGIVKFTTATATASQSIRGTPAYMAPEQWDGQPVPATDQYALAIMAYQLLTGRPPFQGGPGQVMRQHFTAQPQPPSTLNPRISPAVDAVILRALEKKPEYRFPSIMTFAQAFQQALQGAEPSSAPKAQSAARGADIRATLAISRTEAQTGTSRTLTLPGGRKVTVSVPASTQDGQVMHLEGQGELSSSGGPAGSLILTIAIAPTEETVSTSNTNSDETVISTDPKPNSNNSEAVDLSSHSKSDKFIVESDPDTESASLTSTKAVDATPKTKSDEPIPRQPPKTSKDRSMLLVGLALLIIASGVGLFYVVHANQIAAANAHVAAIATAAAAATATIVAANPDPYPPYTGKLVLYDPLSQPNQWFNYSSVSWGGACQFTNGTYHISQSKPNRIWLCSASALDFSNFAFEVQMKVIKGDCGGIDFRNDGSNGKDYIFEVCQSGHYNLYRYTSNSNATSLTNNSSPAISTGLNQSNTIAVVANGSTFDLYVNNQKIDTVSDSSYNHGQIGVDAYSVSNPTEVAFSNTKVWTL